MLKIGIHIGIVILLFSCKKEVGPQSLIEAKKGTGSIIIVNEGNFGFGNASVSIYNPQSKEVFNNQFKEINGFGIGDVLQSVNRHQDSYYFVVNNSGKIVITDTNLVYLSEINGFASPRYIEFVGNKGFVTDLKQGGVYVVDLITNRISNFIKTHGWTETICIANNKVYVLDRGDYLANSQLNYIFVLDPENEQTIDSIPTAKNPNSMVIDDNNELWVLTSGDNGTEKPKLLQIDLLSKLKTKEFIFPEYLDNPRRMVYTDNRLFFINRNLYVMNVVDSLLPAIPFYAKTRSNFYGLSFDAILKNFYLCDAKNYNQQGEVIRIDINGNVIDKILSGIIPQSIQ